MACDEKSDDNEYVDYDDGDDDDGGEVEIEQQPAADELNFQAARVKGKQT